MVLAGGPASRIGGAFKPALVVDGQRMIDWQRQAAKADHEILVAHSEQHFPETGMEMVWMSGKSRGPVQGLQVALSRLVAGPLLVAYADTWWSHTPGGFDWVGICKAQGGRVWDWIGYSAITGKTTWNRNEVPDHTSVRACVGLYCFGDIDALTAATDEAMRDIPGREVQMVDVIKRYEPDMSPIEIPEWLDVGDTASWRHADAVLRGVA